MQTDTEVPRQEALGVLANAQMTDLSGAWDKWENRPAVQMIRGPETGLIMLRGRTGGGGAPFNLGEATVSRASVRIGSGEIGHGYCLGRDEEKARLIAIIDALFQREPDNIELAILRPLRDIAHGRDRQRRDETAATKVEFFTMVRGRRLMQGQTLEGGFAEPVFGAQLTFRALMDALANPGQVQALGAPLDAPVGLAPELAAVALTMCDHDSSVWLDTDLMESEAVLAWLRFHTAAPLTTDPAVAQFALVSSADALPALAQFALGTDEYPDRSTMIALRVPSLTGGGDLTLRGPGINDHAHIAPQGLTDGFVTQWMGNRALFPRGVDLLLVSGCQVLGLPRTTRITMEAH